MDGSILDLTGSHKCIGAEMSRGCPDGADALPSSEQPMDGFMLRIERYHCARCFEVYRRRYDAAGVWP